MVQRRGKKARAATVTKAHASLEDYDILYKDGTLEKNVPVRLLRDKRVRWDLDVFVRKSAQWDPSSLRARYNGVFFRSKLLFVRDDLMQGVFAEAVCRIFC